MATTDHVPPETPLFNEQHPLTYPGQPLRILIVIDGRINLAHDANLFGLGFVIDTLRSTTWLGWLGIYSIELALATREANIIEPFSGGFEVQYKGFRFDEDGFEIDRWDQIWIFADRPSMSADVDYDADTLIQGDSAALGDGEARALAEWMDRGGGLFATGDHNNLGASVCHRIPRVRTMRKWRIADGVPSMEGPRRHQTLQGFPGNANDEFDSRLQPLDLVYTRSVSFWPFFYEDHPHPIMAAGTGPIDHFPDHMHEGEIVPDAEVLMDRPLGIPGYSRPEYPRAVPEILARRFGVESFEWRPRPLIIAYGQTTNRTFFSPTPWGLPSSWSKRFGIVGVYDGEPANIGRVVCDSTWHHWLSMNVARLAASDSQDWKKMQRYYRNIAKWLTRFPRRQRMLTASVWNVLAQYPPMEFTRQQTVWQLGRRVMEIITPVLGPSWVNELVASHFDATSLHQVRDPEDPVRRPDWSRLPETLVNQAVIGSLAKALYPLAEQMSLDCMSRSDVKPDAEVIDKQAEAGVAQVRNLLQETLTAAIDSLTGLRQKLDAKAVSR